jgi:hypothetical protein
MTTLDHKISGGASMDKKTCKYYDRGSCCAPITIETNACKGSCLYPQSCPVVTGIPSDKQKLPIGPSKKVTWQSSNKGGKIQHKNFDEQPTKERKKYFGDRLGLD